MEVAGTRCGWARFYDAGLDGAARFHRSPSGRLVVAELVAAGAAVLEVRAYRLEAWANGKGADAVRAGLADRDRAVRAGQAAWLDDVDGAERAEPHRRAEWGTSPGAEAEQAAMMLVLSVPDDKDDGFYREVARAYGEASVASAQPVRLVAEANGVDRTVVYGWVKEARRRGLMPPARRGAAA